MSNFYLSDPLVLNELRLQDDDFRIYQHCCRQFNVKTFTVFIRLVDIAGQFQMSVEQVQLSLARMTRVRVGGEPLIKIRDNGKFLVFDMPRHKVFIKSIGFQRFNASKGWKHLRDHLSNKEVKIKYLYPKLDQYELLDLLLELPEDQFNNLKETDLQYPWVLRNAKKLRKDN